MTARDMDLLRMALNDLMMRMCWTCADCARRCGLEPRKVSDIFRTDRPPKSMDPESYDRLWAMACVM